MLKISGEFFVFQQDSAQAHRVRETITFLACNLAKWWLVLNFYKHTEQWICSKFSLKMPQHLKCLATMIYDLPLITISVWNCHLFSDIDISQGSVAKPLKWGGIISYQFTANLSLSLTLKEFWKSVKIWQLPPWVWWSSVFETRCIYAFRSSTIKVITIKSIT